MYRKCLGQFDRYKPGLFKHQFFNFYNLFVLDFENLHNPIQLNDICHPDNKLDDSSTSDSENCKYCEIKLSTNMLYNEADICDDRFKSKFVSIYVTYLSR